MIKADKRQDGRTEVMISGDSDTVLIELHIIITQLLKSFYTQGVDILVLQELVDVVDEFKASITNKNFNSKGEKKDD